MALSPAGSTVIEAQPVLARDGLHPAQVDPGGAQAGQCRVGQRVLPNRTRHDHVRPVARRGHRLVGSLAAGFDPERRDPAPSHPA